MKGKILAVGYDEDLLLTRLSVLETRWSAKTGIAGDTLKLLQEGPFDVLVVCHTIPDRQAKSLVRAVRKNFPQVRILALETSPGSAGGLGASATAVTTHGPSQMMERIAALLGSGTGEGRPPSLPA